MKKSLLIPALVITVLSSCNNQHDETKADAPTVTIDTTLQFFGDSINIDGAVDIANLNEQLAGKDSLKIKLTGTIDEVCQKKGCWMNMKTNDGQIMKVRFKDYAFFVPKDAAGKKVYMEGYAYNDTVSVSELKHYAEDAGKTKAEIEQINKPEVTISFEANGVIIKK